MGLKKTVVVLSGSLSGVAFGLLSTLVATQIASPSEYGFYRAFLSSLLLFGSLVHLGLHYTFSRLFALSLAAEDSATLRSSAVVIYTFLSCVVVVVTLSASFISHALGRGHFGSFVLLASVCVLVVLLANFSQQMLQGQQRLAAYSLLSLAPQLALLLVVLFCWGTGVRLSGEVLITTYVASSLAASAAVVFRGGVDLRGGLRRISLVLSANRKFGLQLYFGSVFGVGIGQLLDVVIVGVIGLDSFAHYALGGSLASPIVFVPVTLGIVNFKRNVTRARLSAREVWATVVLTIVAVGVMAAAINVLVPLVIGSEFRGAIPFANVLLVVYSLTGIGDYFNKFIASKGYGVPIRNAAVLVGLTLAVSGALLVPVFGVDGLLLARLLGSIVYLASIGVAYAAVARSVEVSGDGSA